MVIEEVVEVLSSSSSLSSSFEYCYCGRFLGREFHYSSTKSFWLLKKKMIVFRKAKT